MKHTTLTFSLAVALMISPDTLALLGNFIGESGYLGVIIILGSAFVYNYLSNNYRYLAFRNNNQNFHIKTSEASYINIFTTFQFLIKIASLIFIATGLLVSSGFVFNEVFLYWFPNFGFAFLLLALILSFQWVNDTLSKYIQIFTTGFVLAGFIFLIIKGLSITDFSNILQIEELRAKKSNSTFLSFNLKLWAIPLLLFIGFDLGKIVDQNDKAPFYNKRNHADNIAIGFIGVLFCIWGLTILTVLPQEKLINSSISHLLAAKKIAGDSGRYLMGGIIIFGSIAAINGLFMNITYYLKIIEGKKIFSKAFYQKKFFVSVLALIIAGLMACGLAGSQKLEILIRSSLIIWILSYSIVPIFALLSNEFKKNDDPTTHSIKMFKNISMFIIFIAGGITLTAINAYRKELIIYMLMQIFIILLLQYLLNNTQQIKKITYIKEKKYEPENKFL